MGHHLCELCGLPTDEVTLSEAHHHLGLYVCETCGKELGKRTKYKPSFREGTIGHMEVID